MAEYIEREATCKFCFHFGVCDILDPLHGGVPCDKFIPAADVVEVVRCGQCKHATEDIIVEGVCYCHKIQQGMFLDGFCSYGERRNTK